MPSSLSSARSREKLEPGRSRGEFGLKNADRVELKQILRELAADGTIAKRGKKFTNPQRCRQP